MKIYLQPNPDKDNSAACCRAFMAEMLALGMTPLLERSMAEIVSPPEGCVLGEHGELLKACDLVMPVGGDGTLIRCTHGAVEAGKPIIGVNTGRLGFLTQLEACEPERLHLLRDGRYAISPRMMLEGVIEGDGGERRFIALNDIVASRSESSGAADIEVRQGERLITRQRGDGIIFATPTGSTAYSLSAGGPIVDPELELMLLTAICPHATFRCSITLPSRLEYQVREHVVNRECGLVVTADGRQVAAITPRETLRIRKYEGYAQLVDLGLHDFYDSVGEKLSWRR